MYNEKKSFFLKKLGVIFFSAVFLLSFFVSLTIIIKDERFFKILAQNIEITSLSAKIAESSAILPQYQELYTQNNDLADWLKIEGTHIDYPVIYTTDDTEFYLRHAFNGNSSDLGVPFIGYHCTSEPQSSNLIIYGHNVNNGAMFHDLLQYAQQDFYLAHPFIRFDTLKETAQYEIVAAFYAQIYPNDRKNVFRYYHTDLSYPDLFSEFSEHLAQASLFDTGININYGEQLLTISTCSYHTDNGRFVIVARKQDLP